ncbi:hypothetical protein EV421DRAFT_1498518 [Armillaria borealis]|uniref:Uncharacterized protein n=1 Tax=Armillaria borealis TaxID=47425 RepID=A0AA39J0G2_9AGAR|nr:hypothetical protein EV421DRAFT_1498518 [Armillaria borealis]
MQTTTLDASKPRTAGIPEDPSPILGVGDKIGSRDTYIIENLLADDLIDIAFENLKREAHWHTMFRRGSEVPRLVAVEGVIENYRSIPLYRHPADESPLHSHRPFRSSPKQSQRLPLSRQRCDASFPRPAW